MTSPTRSHQGTDIGPAHVLRAQHIMERLMPFLEQEAATTLQEAHALLFQWTTALWGTPIALVAAGPTSNGTGGEITPTQKQSEGRDEEDGASCAATVPFSPIEHALPNDRVDEDHGADAGAFLSDSEAASEGSHRRRRMHGFCD